MNALAYHCLHLPIPQLGCLSDCTSYEPCSIVVKRLYSINAPSVWRSLLYNCTFIKLLGL